MVFVSSRRLLPLLALLITTTHFTSASPYPRDDLHDVGFSYLMPRDCDSYCGSDNQLCCRGDSKCTTVQGDIATCVGGGGGGGNWGAITTTWTQTFTSTIMTHWEPVPEPTEGVDCIPQNDHQEACGPICCAGWQTCAHDGQCSIKPGYVEPSTIVVTTGGKTTTQYSAPYRVTGTTTVVGTSGTATATVTEEPSQTTNTADDAGASETGDSPSGAGGGGGGGLSGGQIAGIVIGSIAGAMLLLLIAFCCIARGLWKACFGGGKKKERVDVYEERYSRHGSRHPSAHSRRDHHGGWFGGGRGSDHSEKKSGGKKWLGLAGLAATLLALLNFKKDKKPARKPARSRYSDSYYSYSDATSPRRPAGSSSSGRRTHRSRRTGDGSRGPPKSYYSGSRSRRS